MRAIQRPSAGPAADVGDGAGEFGMISINTLFISYVKPALASTF
jgi:hypothetical protein